MAPHFPQGDGGGAHGQAQTPERAEGPGLAFTPLWFYCFHHVECIVSLSGTGSQALCRPHSRLWEAEQLLGYSGSAWA